MPKFNRALTREQLAHRAAKKNHRPGGTHQPKGTQPYVHVLPESATWKPIPTADRLLRDIRLARALGIKPRTSIPDMRCPKCNSSRMAKEQLLKCPECGYEGNCVDVNAPKEEPVELESPTGRINIPGPELQNVKPPEDKPKVDVAKVTNISAMEKFKARQHNRVNGGQNGNTSSTS